MGIANEEYQIKTAGERSDRKFVRDFFLDGLRHDSAKRREPPRILETKGTVGANGIGALR